jgi:triosephosphate isomerase
MMLLAPPFTHLMAVQGALEGSDIRLAAQNCHWEEKGAFTGEISASMLSAMGIEYVILGHSERREIFSESNELIRRKVDRSLDSGLEVIFCCGEPLAIREKGEANAFVETQLRESLLHLSMDQLDSIIIAYEPIWAIGTGVTATSEQAQEMHAFIRDILAEAYTPERANAVTILYGGSVKASNAADLFSQQDVDGGLVGGASLSAPEFLQIAAAL